MKQSIWQSSLAFNFLIIFNFLIQFQVLHSLNFEQQLTTTNSTRYYRPDSYARIYNQRHNINFNAANTAKNTKIYTASYNPFINGDLSETYYKFQVFLNTKYRDAQETKYLYIANQRREREQQAQLVITTREQTRKQIIALDVIRDYNRRSSNLNLSEQFCSAKFNNSSQQSLHNQQITIVCELADRVSFPRNIIGLQNFSDTVLEIVSLAYQANCKNSIKLTKSLTDLAQDFLALGRGLVRSGYNFADNVTNAGSNLIMHPINTTKAVANNIVNLTKNTAISLFKVLIFLADSTDEHNSTAIDPYMLALRNDNQERYEQLLNYVETVPRIQKFEQVGEFVGEQILSLIASFLTGKAVTIISDSVVAANLHQAVKVKKKTDKTKPGRISWLSKFGAPGKDTAQTLGLVVAEEYELATLDGLVVSFKNSPTNNQTLFNHAEGYFKHNKSGKKSKHKPTVKTVPDKINAPRIIGHQKSLPELRVEAKELASKMGFKETKDFIFDSCTEKVYKKGNLYISLDRNGHKGGFWKVCDKKKRKYTYDKTLTKIIGI